MQQFVGRQHSSYSHLSKTCIFNDPMNIPLGQFVICPSIRVSTVQLLRLACKRLITPHSKQPGKKFMRSPMLVVFGAILSVFVLQGCESDGSDCGNSQQETGTARDAWNAAIDDADYCTTDSDCAIYTESLQCFYNCGAAVNSSELQGLHDLANNLRSRLDQCEVSPCPMPTCAPRSSSTVCIESKCVFSQSDTP